jgi:hypothetical protein
MVGFAFNNRLLFGGFAGESNTLAGGLNPLNDPAHENLTLLLLDAHRMLDSESAELQKIPAFIELFKQAFPAVVRTPDRKKMTRTCNESAGRHTEGKEAARCERRGVAERRREAPPDGGRGYTYVHER